MQLILSDRQCGAPLATSVAGWGYALQTVGTDRHCPATPSALQAAIGLSAALLVSVREKDNLNAGRDVVMATHQGLLFKN
ncbi:hypothetical protein GOZ78_11595 [Agrobacterium vitis]|uniref:Uncharacterized protein n=1 Tax=Agrobacterium vitis TaxID=373 RepID=A0ABD6GAC3_AGRVI|nr:hypothetical protein [Agrobacterium vitis]MUO82083.1 hypothetical protein [Agrobacterium vitis]MUO97116.1 hypothetical protein [Agrobacterium vitis]MUP06387.1 hypothetical protein [Agrobacterium vitis]MUZ83991.1 hypothetical protein [Agrobacterium vitis]MVA10672.1 hypothetical protein [Agrobacterium vitis]